MLADVGFFVLRSPLLAIDEGARLSAALHARPIDYETLCTHEAFLEAIWLASKRLHGLLTTRQLHTMDGSAKALEKYLLRMTHRTTPFGLFAGVSTGSIGDHLDLQIPAIESSRRAVRLDSGCISDIERQLRASPDVRAVAHLRWNETLIRRGDQHWHYVASLDESFRRAYRTRWISSGKALTVLRERLGPMFRLADLRHHVLALQPALSPPELNALLGRFLEQGLVLADVSCPVTGEKTVDRFIQDIEHLGSAGSRAARALEIASAACARASVPLASSAWAAYTTATNALQEEVSAAALANPVQVDLIKDAPRLTLPADFICDVARDLEAVGRVVRSPSVWLDQFTERFSARYGREEVPMLEAIDRDLGVGFGYQNYGADALLGNAAFLENADETPHQALTLDLLNRRLIGALATRQVEPEGAFDLPASWFSSSLPSHAEETGPASAAIVGTLVRSDTSGALMFQVRQSVGPTAASWLGRFCESDAKLMHQVTRLTRLEEQQEADVLVADLLHAPPGRDRNVIAHPHLRGHELVYAARSGLDNDRVIPVDDLTLRVVKGRLELRSRCLQRPVVPRQTCAHNPRRLHLPPIYQFLGLLARRGPVLRLPSFQPALTLLGKLPRLTYRHLILQPRAWHLDGERTFTFLQALADQGTKVAVEMLRQQLELPRYIRLGEGEATLQLDLAQPVHVELLVEALASKEPVTLYETCSQDQGLVTDTQGQAYANEIILPLMIKRAAETSASRYPLAALTPRLPAAALTRVLMNARPAPDSSTAKRAALAEELPQQVPPTGDWLYLEIPCGRALANLLLSRHIAPLLTMGHRAGSVERWYFIRYDEGRPHLRLRLQGNMTSLFTEWLPALRERLHDSGHVIGFSIETYEREMARYGGPVGMQFAEALFCCDSQMCLDFLSIQPASMTNRVLVDFGLASLDALLRMLGLNLSEQYLTMNRVCEKYYREFGITAERKRSLDANFRRLTRDSSVLGRMVQGSALSSLDPMLATAIRSRESALLTALDTAGPTVMDWHLGGHGRHTAPDFIHMSCNRLFSANRRLQELQLCDLLRRAYESGCAKEGP
ncbi:lantibiotic dehydratase [Rhizobacter sp. P5_C2]